MKKILSIILSCVLALGLMGVLTGCGDKKNSTTNNAQNQMGSRDIYAISAVSSAQALGGIKNSGLKNATNKYALMDIDNTTVSDDDLKNIAQYLDMFEGLMKNDNVDTSKPNESDGEYASYGFKTIITFPNGETFKMYYNETNKTTNEEVETDDEDEVEVEVSSTLEGVMIVGEVKYEITGDKEVETEGDEQEMSIQFSTKKVGTDIKIVVEQSYEMEEGEKELEFAYKLYKGDKKIQETTVEWENEKDETELEIYFSSRLSTNIKNKYHISLNGDTFTIDSKLNGVKVATFTATKTETGYKFTFENGNIKDIAKDILDSLIPSNPNNDPSQNNGQDENELPKVDIAA